jgi:hypothetical protein
MLRCAQKSGPTLAGYDGTARLGVLYLTNWNFPPTAVTIAGVSILPGHLSVCLLQFMSPGRARRRKSCRHEPLAQCRRAGILQGGVRLRRRADLPDLRRRPALLPAARRGAARPGALLHHAGDGDQGLLAVPAARPHDLPECGRSTRATGSTCRPTSSTPGRCRTGRRMPTEPIGTCRPRAPGSPGCSGRRSIATSAWTIPSCPMGSTRAASCRSRARDTRETIGSGRRGIGPASFTLARVCRKN